MSADKFVVSIYFGNRIVSWPFGRLDITPERIGVRSWPVGRRSITVPKSDVTSISVKKGRAVSTLKIADAEGNLGKVVIELPFSLKRIISQFENYDYQLTDGGR
jgi:hypothetical protein